MAKVETVRCDECGLLRLEGNHWLRAVSQPGERFEICTSAAYHLDGGDYPVLDLCSEKCAVTAMTKAIGSKPPSNHCATAKLSDTL